MALLNDVSSPPATTAAGQRQLAFSLCHNPARSAATVVGMPPKSGLRVLDLLGCTIAHTTADATGIATPLALPASLSLGVYLVRSGTQAERLTVE